MTEPQLQENQQELFANFAQEPQAQRRHSPLGSTQKPILISTTLEQILLAGMVSILIFCLVFFLGVLRGRSHAYRQAGAISSLAPKLTPPVVHAAPAVAPVVRMAVPTAPPVVAVKKDTTFVVITEAPAKPYTIQVLTTKKKAYAESEAATLRKRGFLSWAAKSGDYYVVCVGSYANKEEARKDLSYFGTQYKGRYLRRK